MEFFGTDAGRVADAERLVLAVPTLFIGMGGTGKQVLMRFRKRLFDAHRKPRLDHSRFLLLDTDMQSLIPHKERPEDYQDSLLRSEDGETIACGIAPGEFQSVLEDIRFRNDPRWAWMHPDMQTYPPMQFQDGAGTIRQAGRLAFFLKYQAIRTQIQEHIRQLHSHATNNMETVDIHRMEFVLVTSLAGGTGSGIFIDVAFLLRDIIMQDPILNNAIERRHTTLIAVLPTIFARDEPNLAERFQQNGYASMLEMEYYNTPRPEDTCFAPARVENDPRAREAAGAAPVEFRAPWSNHPIRATAWDTCYLIDDINDRRPGADTTSKDLYQMIADYLFLDFDANPFAIAKRSARSNNVQMRDRILLDEVLDNNRRPIFANRYGCTFSSFGLAEMLIDRDKICRAASYRLAYRIIEHLWQGKAGTHGENTYKKFMEQDLYEKNSASNIAGAVSMHPNTLWRAFLTAEGRDWYQDCDADFDQAKGESADEESADKLDALMSKHERRVGSGGEARATMEHRKGQLGGSPVDLGICRQIVAKTTRDRFNTLGAEATLQLLTYYYTTFDMARKWAVTQANQPVDKPHDILAQLRDAARVSKFPYNCRGKAIDVVFPPTCEASRARALARYQVEACGYLEKLATTLRDYTGKPGDKEATVKITTLNHDFTEIRDYLTRMKKQLDDRFKLTKRATDTPRKKLFLPEWDGPEYDRLIIRALLDTGIPEGEPQHFDWKKLEEVILNAIRLPAGTTDRSRLDILKRWMKITNEDELAKRAEDLADACYGILKDGISLEEFKKGYVVDYVEEHEEKKRKEYLTNLLFYSAPYLPSLGNHDIDTRFPPHYVNLLGWVPSDELRREGRDAALQVELNGISIHGSDNHIRDRILPAHATVPTCIALVREMTGVPLNYYSRLPILKRSYDNPVINRYRLTCHLDAMERDLPDIDAIRPEEHEQLRNGAETALRALVLRWIYFEAPDFVVEVKDDDTQYGNIKWHLGSRITRIIKHACVNEQIRRFLTVTWNNWRGRATTTQLAVTYLALQQTLNLFPQDAGHGYGNDPGRRPPLQIAFRKVLEGIGNDLLDKGEEGKTWMDLFRLRNALHDTDFEVWRESYDKVSRYIREACLRPASRDLPIWQVDHREVGKVSLAGALQLIPTWQQQPS